MKREPINHQEFHESALSEVIEPKVVGYGTSPLTEGVEPKEVGYNGRYC